MRRVLGVVLLSLAACATGDAKTATVPSDPQTWRLPTGKAPTQVEYTALVAACQDKVRSTGKEGRIAACLSGDYDLRRVP